MVTQARANTQSKQTRENAHEAACLDEELAKPDPWAVEARENLETRYAAAEAAEESLHQCVTEVSDKLE